MAPSRMLGSLALFAASNVLAFPGLLNDNGSPLQLENEKRQSSSSTPFDADSQYVSTSGSHAFIAPGPLAARGPCPGLNAMANHGYLPRSGVATIPQFISGTHDAFGMGTDLATILAAYGGVFDGGAALWSIGGQPHTGISGSHNNYESDNSPLRADLNQYGSNTRLVIEQFNELYNLQPDAATANYDLDVLKSFRGTRFNESIDKNPYFFFGPFSGAVVTQAAYTFIYRFMGNKSAEHPDGLLNKDVLKSFMSVSGPDDALTWTPGHERFPDNWYRRNDNDLYNISRLSDDIGYITAGQEYVQMPGCNTGKVDSFQQIDVAAMTNGAYTPESVLADPVCFGIASANAQAQKLPIVSNVIAELVLPIQNTLGCVTIPDLDSSASDACPGNGQYGGPTGKVAPGAVQS